MIVAKFGGSSLADASQFQKVKAIVEADPERQIIVCSAAGKTDENPIIRSRICFIYAMLICNILFPASRCSI